MKPRLILILWLLFCATGCSQVNEKTLDGIRGTYRAQEEAEDLPDITIEGIYIHEGPTSSPTGLVFPYRIEKLTRVGGTIGLWLELTVIMDGTEPPFEDRAELVLRIAEREQRHPNPFVAIIEGTLSFQGKHYRRTKAEEDAVDVD